MASGRRMDGRWRLAIAAAALILVLVLIAIWVRNCGTAPGCLGRLSDKGKGSHRRPGIAGETRPSPGLARD